ncbi:hypothetical protein EYF80_013870 [Liparis tanakae]|uniref:Uncharacterized protein n=1 Tax=Liparis tanakae TaxID=230148 RepID=A0A4Z2ID66_9TELE|nr:hypothetical protein EYF80_013870 [Liparis tanakae]
MEDSFLTIKMYALLAIDASMFKPTDESLLLQSVRGKEPLRHRLLERLGGNGKHYQTRNE